VVKVEIIEYPSKNMDFYFPISSEKLKEYPFLLYYGHCYEIATFESDSKSKIEIDPFPL
jgi:hypothetical protein